MLYSTFNIILEAQNKKIALYMMINYAFHKRLEILKMDRG